MSEPTGKYGVSYIASAPEELKVGDKVVIENPGVAFYQRPGTVAALPTDDEQRVLVQFKDCKAFCHVRDLRKLSEAIPDKGEMGNPLNTQVGGSHYKDMAIQPIEFSMKNGLNACQHSVIKYICRYKNKNGKEDLLKAKHFIDLLIQLEYPE